MTIVDTSVWIEFFRGRPSVRPLRDLIAEDEAACHEAIVGELAVGTLPHRTRTLAELRSLTFAPSVATTEIFDLVERRRLYGRGLGWVDVSLLASALDVGAGLWTRDRRLADTAIALGLPIFIRP